MQTQSLFHTKHPNISPVNLVQTILGWVYENVFCEWIEMNIYRFLSYTSKCIVETKAASRDLLVIFLSAISRRRQNTILVKVPVPEESQEDQESGSEASDSVSNSGQPGSGQNGQNVTLITLNSEGMNGFTVAVGMET